MTDLGPYLRAARERRGLGLREAAGLAEISPSYLSRLETGDEKRPPSEATLRRLATVLDVDHDELCRLAGRVPADVVDLLLAEPGRFAMVRSMWAPRAKPPMDTEEETER